MQIKWPGKALNNHEEKILYIANDNPPMAQISYSLSCKTSAATNTNFVCISYIEKTTKALVVIVYDCQWVSIAIPRLGKITKYVRIKTSPHHPHD